MKSNRASRSLFSLTLLLAFLPSCDRQPTSVANWDTYTTPVFEGADTHEVGQMTVWHRGDVEYYDQDQDGVIDKRIEESEAKTVTWDDLNHDGVFDVEHISTGLPVDPNKDGYRQISVPVPATK